MSENQDEHFPNTRGAVEGAAPVSPRVAHSHTKVELQPVKSHVWGKVAMGAGQGAGTTLPPQGEHAPLSGCHLTSGKSSGPCEP